MQDETPIWSYIPLADFDAPSPPPSDAARGAARLWQSLQGVLHRPEKKTSREAPQWDRPANDVLRSLSPDPDWEQAAALLPGALGDDWFDKGQPARPRYALVGPPGCDVAEVLQALARERRLDVLSAPSPEELLQAPNPSASNEVDESGAEILVIPHLERWYLRHEDGLAPARNLIERLVVGRKRVLVGCDSWAWAFLRHAIGIQDMLGEPHTFAPFDAKRLDAWFRSTLDFREFEFRQRGDEEPVFPELPEADEEKTPRESSTFIRTLAARARGNPGVALALWRASLRTCDTDAPASAAPASTSPSALWAVSPDELENPLLSVELDRVHRFVLHSVLLHGELSISSLIALLPLSSEEIHGCVRVMHRGGILEEQEGRLRVALMAYPFVRQALLSEGFLTDAF